MREGANLQRGQSEFLLCCGLSHSPESPKGTDLIRDALGGALVHREEVVPPKVQLWPAGCRQVPSPATQRRPGTQACYPLAKHVSSQKLRRHLQRAECERGSRIEIAISKSDRGKNINMSLSAEYMPDIAPSKGTTQRTGGGRKQRKQFMACNLRWR